MYAMRRSRAWRTGEIDHVGRRREAASGAGALLVATAAIMLFWFLFG